MTRRLRRRLRRNGYDTIRSTTNTRRAPALVAASDPDLVLLDLSKPSADGFALLERVCRSSSGFYRPVLVVTELAPSTKQRAMMLGATDILCSPFDDTELALRVGTLMDTRLLQCRLQARNAALEDELRTRTRELEAAAALLSQAYAGMTCGVLVRDPTGLMVSANAAAECLLGATLADLSAAGPNGRPYTFERLDGMPLQSDNSPASRALRTGQPQRETLVIVRPDGERRVVQSDAIPQHNPDGTLARVVVSFVDVSDRVAAEARLRSQATHDALTGLHNRAALIDHVAAAAHAGQCALLLLDLDDFKGVNDTRGHHTGDALLCEVATRLRLVVGPDRLVARLGGDEFACVLPHAEEHEAQDAARRIQQVFDEAAVIDGQPLRLGGSIGIAVAPRYGSDARTLLRCADRAMYAAKRSRCGYALYDPSDDWPSPVRLSCRAG